MMKLEKGMISSSQLLFLIGSFIQGSTLLVAFAAGVTKQDTWLAVLAGWAASVPFALVYVALAQKFPGKNLVQMNDIIYGPFLGKIISLIYMLYFLSLVFLNLRDIGEFIATYILTKTPMVVVFIMFMFICAWAVRSGIEVIARTGVIFSIVALTVTMLTFMLLLKDMKWTNFLPVFEVPLKKFFQGTHIIASIPFCEIFVFLMVIPYSSGAKRIRRAVLSGLVIGGITMLGITVRNTAILGNLTALTVSPSFEAVRLINIADVITRLEVLVAVTLLFMGFVKISVLYYATALGTAQLFRLRSYKPLVIPLGIISICLAVLVFESIVEHYYWGEKFSAVYELPFQFLLPLLSLLISKIRGLPEKKG